MKHTYCALIAGVVFFACVNARAEVQAEVSILRSEFRELRSVLQTGQGFRLGGSYFLEESPVFFQLNYLQSGDNDFDIPAGFGISGLEKFTGFTVSPGLRGVINPVNGSSVWIKGIFYQGKSTAEFTDSVDPSGSFSNSISGTGFGFGLGAEWKVTPHTAIRLDYDTLLDVKFGFPDEFDPSVIVTIPEDLTLLGLGIAYTFGASKAAAPSTSPAPPAADFSATPAAAPVMTPAPVSPAPAPAPAATPEAPASAPAMPTFTSGALAQAKTAANLLSRAVQNSAPVVALDAGTVLTLRTEMRNAAGKWWYAEAGGKRGWILESELDPKSP